MHFGYDFGSFWLHWPGRGSVSGIRVTWVLRLFAGHQMGQFQYGTTRTTRTTGWGLGLSQDQQARTSDVKRNCFDHKNTMQINEEANWEQEASPVRLLSVWVTVSPFDFLHVKKIIKIMRNI